MIRTAQLRDRTWSIQPTSDLSHLTSTGELTSQSTLDQAVDRILHENQPKTRLQYLLLIDRRLDSLY
jgi:hypothetical protein